MADSIRAFSRASEGCTPQEFGGGCTSNHIQNPRLGCNESSEVNIACSLLYPARLVP